MKNIDLPCYLFQKLKFISKYAILNENEHFHLAER